MVINSTTKNRIQFIETRILGSFEETICSLSRLPNMCSCGATYDLQHSLTSKKGGFVSLRHKHLRNRTANLIDKTCYDVRAELPLQILTGETFDSRSRNARYEARLDISATRF